MPPLVFRLLADATVIVHLAFVAFVVAGGLLVLRWPRVIWMHLPAAAWGAWVEFAGWICPLTPLENWLRERSGGCAYSAGFIEHYVVPTLYPDMLTRGLQWMLGTAVLLINLAVYAVAWRRSANRQRR